LVTSTTVKGTVNLKKGVMLMVFHGIDLHTDSFVDAKMSAGGTIQTTKYYLDQESFKKFKDQLSKEDYILVESCSNAFWFYDQVIDLVKECYVLDVNKFKAGINKTDKIDTKKLVKRLAYYVTANGDSNDLPLVYVPPKAVRELRALFSTYQLNKKTVTQFKNRIHSILKQNGYPLPRKEIFSLEFRPKLLEIPLGDTWQFQLKTLLKQMEGLEQETETIKQEIYKLGYQLYPKEIRILLSIKGFSSFTAIALMSDVVDINRFPSVKKFCAYLRTAPKVKSSNDKTIIGPTNRYSRSLTCTLMSQSVIHFSGAGDHLSTFYERVKKGKKPSVSRMALIRKTLVCAYYMLKRDKLFLWVDEKLYQQKLKEFGNIVSNNSTSKENAA
jgi:transposase